MPAAPRVLVRADGGRRIGTGHLVRTLSLVDELAERGAEVTYATRSMPADLVGRLTGAGHRHVDLGDAPAHGASAGDGPWPEAVQHDDGARLERVCRSGGYELVIVDHYGLDRTWEQRVRSLAARIVVVDDLADRCHDCDVLVDHNWYGPHTAGRYADLVPGSCLQLLGPRYALLQRAYRELREDRDPVRWPPQRVCVSYGGTDPTGESAKALEALSDPGFRHLDVEVAVGIAGTATPRLRELVAERPRTRLHVALPTLAPLLAGSDLALGASGAATWERLCLGVPGLVTTTSVHHAGVTAAFAEAGVLRWLGSADSTTASSYREAIQRRLGEPLGEAPPLVDGYGTARAVQALLPSGSSPELRPARRADLPALLGDDPGVAELGQCVLSGPDVWWSGTDELIRALTDPSAAVFVVEVDGVPVGRALRRETPNGPAAEVALHDAVRDRGGLLQVVTELALHAAGSTGITPA